MIKRIKIENALKEWLEYKRNFVKESTCMSYSLVLYNYFLPFLKNMYMHQITQEKIQDIVFKWMSKDSDINLSASTAKTNITILKDFINYARKRNYMKYIELEIKVPRNNSVNKVKVLQKNEYEKVIRSTINSNNLKDLGLLLTLYTGLRIGEVCALMWKDIDFDKRLLTVSKSLQRIFIKEGDKTYTKIIITFPKTKNAVREIPLADSIIDKLKALMPNNLDTYVLTGSDKYIEPRTYRNYFNRFLKNNEINHINFHSLRHTFATKCIELGVDYKTVSELLGHSSVNITLNLYVHPQIEQKRRCIEILENSYKSSLLS